MWYCEDMNSLYSKFASKESGLDDAQVGKSTAKYGKNELIAKKKKSFIKKLLLSLCDRMTIVLLAASLVSFVTSYLSGEGYADPIIILIIVMANGLISVIQENRAEKALDALKAMSSPETRVIRNGVVVKIPSRDVVPGDIFLLEKGDVVPCDARLIEANELTLDESALTGESCSVAKDANGVVLPNSPISEITNSVFTSSHVISGRAKAIAVKTGMESCVGEIASLLSEESEKTPLQKRLAKLSLLLGNLTLAICVVIFIFSLFKGMDVGEMFMTSVSLSVAAIPEGLPAIVTVVLSAGVQTLARKKAIVKRLPAVETLGCAQIICSDKTGTLTCNKMTVESVYGDIEELKMAFALCNNDSSPTERALTDYIGDHDAIRARYERVFEIPFDSVKKYMLTIHRVQDGFCVYLKGAPDVVSEFCLGREREIEEATLEMTKNALRVICFAKYNCQEIPKDPLKGNFGFIGLCGIYDPPRPEARESVRICKRAGIRPIMITGDHQDTARAIAERVGIIEKGGRVATERELKDKSEQEFARVVEECNVFARVTPNFKLRIVSALKSKGYVVAMTGDGVNDAPALKRADIGCAMGISGTEVAKESADMILTDDNFSTVVEAVKEGRGIYENIRRAVHFLLSCNIGELFCVFFAILASLPSPLSAILLLWVNLTTDSLPAIALGLEPASIELMTRPPMKPETPLFSFSRTLRIIFEGLLIGTLAISAFVIGCNIDSFGVGRTMCFLVLGISQLFHSFNLRSEGSIFSKKRLKNPFVTLAFVFCLILQSSVVLIPAACRTFGLVSLSAFQWIICLLLSACPLLICEVYKRFTL